MRFMRMRGLRVLNSTDVRIAETLSRGPSRPKLDGPSKQWASQTNSGRGPYWQDGNLGPSNALVGSLCESPEGTMWHSSDRIPQRGGPIGALRPATGTDGVVFGPRSSNSKSIGTTCSAGDNEILWRLRLKVTGSRRDWESKRGPPQGVGKNTIPFQSGRDCPIRSSLPRRRVCVKQVKVVKEC